MLMGWRDLHDPKNKPEINNSFCFLFFVPVLFTMAMFRMEDY